MKRWEEKPTSAASAAFILQPRWRDLDNKLNAQMAKKSGCCKGCGENESVEGRSYTSGLKRVSSSPPPLHFINANAAASFQPTLKPVIKRNLDANCSFSKPCIPNCSEFALSY